MRGSAVMLTFACAIGVSAGPASAQGSVEAVGVGGRVEVPEAGFAVTFPDDWVWYRTPVADASMLVDVYAGVADPEFADVFEEYVLFHEDDWRDELELFGEEDWFGELAGISAHPASGDKVASPYDRCDIATLSSESLAGYVDEQFDLWEQYGRELYPEGIEVTEVTLPAGEAVRLDTFDSTEYAVLGGVGVVRLYCVGLVVPEDHWLSVAEMLEVLDHHE